MIEVTLSYSEGVIVAYIGTQRRIVAMKKGRTEPYGTPNGDLWGNDIESSGAECAVAKAINQHWNMVIQRDLSETPPDVGTNVQVRWTPHTDGHLPVYKRDKDSDRFYFVTGKLPTFQVVGWILGSDAKQPGFWRERTPRGTPAWWVKQEALSMVYPQP